VTWYCKDVTASPAPLEKAFDPLENTPSFPYYEDEDDERDGMRE
jgi:hypothetical protein